MEKGISKMTVDEIITRFLEDRGLDPTDKKLRTEYDWELVRKAKAGDSDTLIELVKVGTHYGPNVRMKEK
jgi:hypothetical protein